MVRMTARQTVERFMASINAHDVEAIVSCMTPDHHFIDSTGARVVGIEPMTAAWTAYFEMVPDYRTEVDTVFEAGEQVVLLGRASGTLARGGASAQRRWMMPTAWSAVVVDGLVQSWQVYADNSVVDGLLRESQS